MSFILLPFITFINTGKILIPFYVHKMHGIGTPEDLNTFINRKNIV